MIRFKRITAKNFGSYGNHQTTIDLSSHSTNLVVGTNGSGKSTLLLDGIFFALFNKPYRKITKGLLVNSLNKGGTLVEIEFDTRGSNYVVRRGIKPNIFEIVKDGEILDQGVLSKDSQEYLEEDILQINAKTFGQTAVLGSSSFVPFMQLTASARREVVDDVLDVHVYTRMAELVKEDLAILVKELDKKEKELALVKNSFTNQKSLIKVMESGQKDLITELKANLDSILNDKVSLHSKINSKQNAIDLKLDEKIELSNVSTEKNKFQHLDIKINAIQAQMKEIDSLDVCPTCLQSVSDEHKHSIEEKSKQSLLELKSDYDELKIVLDAYKEAVTKNDAIDEELRELRTEVKYLKIDLHVLEEEETQVKLKINSTEENSLDKLDAEKAKAKELAKQGSTLTKEIDEIKGKKAVQEISVKLLKDSGIKASIIKDYLPTINKLLNDNLRLYGFDISFNLDENFDESISSRGREGFVYNSFSEGEKERIDYSIMLALRSVASSKNAANINLLVLDEILDGSLDKESRAATLQILTQGMEESNVFVISHTESQPTFYDRVLKVSRNGDFSQIDEE